MKDYYIEIKLFDCYELLFAVRKFPHLTKKIFFNGQPSYCDLCGASFEKKLFLFDICLNENSNPWGYVCSECFCKGNLKIGWGKGQLFTRLEDDSWLLIDGYQY